MLLFSCQERRWFDIKYIKEEIEQANNISLTGVASRLGYTVKRIGGYHTTKEMDSLRIYNDRTWYRFSGIESGGKSGGNVLDFLIAYGNMTFPEAVEWSLENQGYMKAEDVALAKNEANKQIKKKVFVLPKRNEDQIRLVNYLMEERKISYETIATFIYEGLIYESEQYHNMVSIGKDKEGVVRYAGLRGLYDIKGQKPFKCDVAGNDKNYGVNFYVEGSSTVVVFEGVIDMLSYYDIKKNFESLLSLGMVEEAPLDTFLAEYPDMKKIVFALDHDRAGLKATRRLKEKYSKLGYEVSEYNYPRKMKDVNKYLIARRNKRAKRRGTKRQSNHR